MRYMGSKSKIAKQIVPIIQGYIDENDIKYYLEPFCGGMNVIDKIKCEHKIASDINKYLIALLSENNKIDTLPSAVTKEQNMKIGT